MRQLTITAILAALVAGSLSEASAQMAAPSARSFAFAGSYVARARGYEASFWNPANLGLPDAPSWSLGLAGASAYLNNNSLSYGQISDLYGEFLDDATKSELLADIRAGEPDRMLEASADVGAHIIGASIWRFAFGVSSVGAGNLNVNSDAVELLLFGNAGEDGSGKDFSLDGSEAQAWAFTGGFASYAHPITIPGLDYFGMKFSVGATLKYGVAHTLARLFDRGTIMTANPLAVDVEAEAITSVDASAGQFWSLDLGAAMEYDRDLVVGVVLSNALANVSWNEEEFELHLLTAQADFDSTTSNDTTLAFSELTAEQQDQIIELLGAADVAKELRLGGVYRVTPMFTASFDYVELMGGNLRSRWDRTFSAGGELRPVSFLPLRIGLATDFGHLSYTGGFGIYAGPVHTDFAIGRWGVAGGDGIVGAISVSIWPGNGY